MGGQLRHPGRRPAPRPRGRPHPLADPPRPRRRHRPGDRVQPDPPAARDRRAPARAPPGHPRCSPTAAGRCLGVEVCDGDTGATRRLLAGAVVLASGGAGRLWRHTTNPQSATGDGVALAFEAGAECASMEFVQFHPTALALEGAPRFLISEAVRGEGARVVNAPGRALPPRRRPAGRARPAGHRLPGDLARASALGRRAASTCDCTDLADRAAVRFPTIHRTCMGFGIDIGRTSSPSPPPPTT